MSKPVILTGLRANNDLHIGNYFGALLPIIDIANKHSAEYQVNIFVPDLHSFTTPMDHTKLKSQIFESLKTFVAAGLPLNNPDVYIYRQSYIPAHSEMTWILDCFTSVGEMNRMTQFKEKSAKINEKRVSVGLYHYPVLMASDILLYGAKYVPVGDDQSQHLEFTRDVAERFNKMFDGLLELPDPVLKQYEFFGKDQGLRIRDLTDPTKKMSKSNDASSGVIFLNDTPELASKKVMGATTDSASKINFDYDNQPGISNLLDLHKLLGGDNDQFLGQSQYGPLKEAVAKKVTDFLSDFQQKLESVNENSLLNKLQASEVAMNKQANQTLGKVQKAIGLR